MALAGAAAAPHRPVARPTTSGRPSPTTNRGAGPATTKTSTLEAGTGVGSVRPDAGGGAGESGLPVPGMRPGSARRLQLLPYVGEAGAGHVGLPGDRGCRPPQRAGHVAPTGRPGRLRTGPPPRQRTRRRRAVQTPLGGALPGSGGWFGFAPRPLGGGRHHVALLTAFLLCSGRQWFAMQPSSGFDPATLFGALGLSLAIAVILASDLPEVLHIRRRYRERARSIAPAGPRRDRGGLPRPVAGRAIPARLPLRPGWGPGPEPVARPGRVRAPGRPHVRGAAGPQHGAWLALAPDVGGGRRDGQEREHDRRSRACWAASRPSTGYLSNTSGSPPKVVIDLIGGFAGFSFTF